MIRRSNICGAALILLTAVLAGCGGTGLEPEEPEPTPELETRRIILNINNTDIDDSAPLNPFFGGKWLNPDPASGFVYIFQNNGTIEVVHHCGLYFSGQFSYFIWKNILAAYGSEMDADELRVEVITRESPFSFSAVSVVGTVKTHSYEWAEEIDGMPIEGEVTPEDSVFTLSNYLTGTWRAGSVEYVFGNDGTLTAGAAVYSYLLRSGNSDVLVTLAHDGSKILQVYRVTKTGAGSVTLFSAGETTALVKAP
jgi:hypothetical protein